MHTQIVTIISTLILCALLAGATSSTDVNLEEVHGIVQARLGHPLIVRTDWEIKTDRDSPLAFVGVEADPTVSGRRVWTYCGVQTGRATLIAFRERDGRGGRTRRPIVVDVLP